MSDVGTGIFAKGRVVPEDVVALSNTLFPGAFSHRTRRTTAQAKDVTSASKKNS